MNLSKAIATLATFSLLQNLPAVADNQFGTYQEAAFYHFNSHTQWELGFQYLQKLQLSGHETILNVGSRSGRMAAYLASRLPQGKAIGVDSHPGMIAFAQANYGPALYPNLRFIQNDTLENYFTNVIDYVVSINALHWFPEQKVFLSKVHQALKPGGRILFIIPITPLKPVNDVFEDLSASAEWKEYYKNYNHPRKKFTPDEYRALLTEANFRDIEVEVIPFHYAFETKRDLIDWWSAFSPFLLTLPMEKRQPFLIDFAHCYVRHCPFQVDGRIPFDENYLLIKAVK